MNIGQLDEAAIFCAARQIGAGAAQDEYLRQACGDDPVLRDRVATLLKADAEDSEFLESPAVCLRTVAGLADISEAPGTTIGPYKLLEQIGSGGMGLVFMAEQQQPLRRLVALKIIKPGMDTRQVIARFEAERQALALMDHPNIARIYDAGATGDSPSLVDSPPGGVAPHGDPASRSAAKRQPSQAAKPDVHYGRPYFVMELVRGIPVTDYCDQARRPTRERLQLFITICEAVQHAHQKGIIHRDLKPSNILVTMHDDKAVPKIIDFGVAKATNQRLVEQTLFTNFAQMIGTPTYMSPEQAQMSGLDVDTRSDVYSLGVLLYELLTGATPFDKNRLKKVGYEELRRIIRDEDPPTPSARVTALDANSQSTIAGQRAVDRRKFTQTLRGDLDWIVMKSLEKDRDRRYESASAFAADVRRYLDDQPVEAGRPSAGYRLRKFTRRNQGPAVAAVAVVGALLAGIAGTTWGMLRADAARKVAVAAQRAESQRAEGESHARQEAVREKTNALAAAEAEKQAKQAALAVLDFVEKKVIAAARPEGQGGGLGYDVTLRHALAAALPAVHEGFTDQPLVEARLRRTFGNSFAYLGDPKTAAEQFDAARALYTRHVGPRHPDTLASTNGLASSYRDLGRIAEALSLHEETLALMKTELGPDHPETLGCMVNLAVDHRVAGRPNDALRLGEAALAIMKAKIPDHTFTLNCMCNLANCFADLGQHAEAVKLRAETLPLLKTKFGPDHPETLGSMINLANSYSDVGRYADAVLLREETLVLLKAKLGVDHLDTLGCMNNLAISYSEIGRHQEALKLREEAVAVLTAKFGVDHPQTLSCMNNLAMSYADLGRAADAVKLREQTLALQKTRLGPEHVDTLASMNNLAISYAELGRNAEALKLREETLARHKAALGVDHPDTLGCMSNLADSYAALGQNDEALKLREETLVLMRAKIPDHPFTLNCMNNLAESYAALGRNDEALKLREETLVVRKSRFGADHPGTILSMGNLAQSYRVLGRYAEAAKLHEETLELRKARLGPDHPHTLWSMSNLADTYSALGRYAEALRLHEETLLLRQAKLGPDHPDTLQTMNGLAWLLANCPDPERRNPGRAIELARKTVATAPDVSANWNTLGAAQYRAQDWNAAVTALEKSMALSNGGDSFDWFFLTMAQWRLGRHEEARQRFDRAVEWREKNRPGDAELRQLQAEAAELLAAEMPTDP
jgi:serine/threonine protein kinase/tetratricopeptide (TPR) repeat protein